MKLPIISSIVLFSVAPTAFSAPGTPPGQPFQGVVEEITEEIEQVKDQINDLETDLGSLQGDVDDIANDVSSLSNTLEVQVVVHTDACASVPVQCGADAADEHTYEAASSSNHNPFPIRILVSKNGSPVSGLSASQFDYNNSFVPAGGTSSSKCDVECGPSWFQDAGHGVYSVYVDRSSNDGENWDAGNYAGMVKVTDTDGANGSALVSFSLE
ncbi:hypothetical protein [Kangiella sediminilitoris]|uniref:Uncharacterized protein n=1 Tax=Kangiella sediminilitoris TaxID=1144748 RepID=A0A1B3BBU5_9GAMM|nr:hypothetical protein [Kangiella sediminilitoris]AOE50259.1 hypothetical protein KS2013_1549 [Kangiella sediminilitoris]